MYKLTVKAHGHSPEVEEFDDFQEAQTALVDAIDDTAGGRDLDNTREAVEALEAGWALGEEGGVVELGGYVHTLEKLP